MRNRRKRCILHINAAIRNLSGARLALRHQKNRSAVRKIRKSQIQISRGSHVISSKQQHGKNRRNRILTQPIGPSSDNLIGRAVEASGGINDIPGILVGHAEDESRRTGCTVILYPRGAVPGVDVRGGFPGTEQTDALHPGTATDVIQGILLTGGSNFGLAATAGVMNWLAEHGIGAPTEAGPLPTVSSAVIFDLIFAKGSRRPDAAMGYAASQAANSGPVAEGSVGAGAGATVGRYTAGR